MNDQRPIYICYYEDGTTKAGSYLQTLEWFEEARNTDNSCTVRPAYTGYNPT